VSREKIALHPNGLPKICEDLRPLIAEGQPELIRVILTILNITKSLTDLSLPNDVSSITSPYTGQDVKVLVPEIQACLNDSGLIGKVQTDHTEYHLTTKSSPNGNLALGDSLGELSLIRLRPELLAAIKDLGGTRFGANLDELINNLRVGGKFIGAKLRKLFFVQDKEAKSRPVAIFDYWSQTSLIALHKSLFAILKTIPEDMTFNQSEFTKRIDTTKTNYCYDLSNATDRFPISFQIEVLSILIGKSKAKSWATILTGLPFDLNGQQVQYSTGQPMGAYSSWAVFALCHHLVVWIAARRAGKPRRGQYILLGDDIVIFDQAIAHEYRLLMTYLGVEISPSKSIISDDLLVFANRYFLRGTEVSPFALSGLNEAHKHPSDLAEFLRTMLRNGWSSLIGLTPEDLCRMLDLFHRAPSNRRLAERTLILLSLPVRGIFDGSAKIHTSIGISDCFNRELFLLREFVLLEYLKDFEENVEKMRTLFLEWADTHLKEEDYFLLPAPNGIAKRKTYVLPFDALVGTFMDKFSMGLFWVINQSQTGLPVYDWESLLNYKSLNIMPDPTRALKVRNSIAISRTQSSLLIRALSLMKKESLTTSLLSTSFASDSGGMSMEMY